MDVTQPPSVEEIDAMPIEDIRQQFAGILSDIVTAYGDDRAPEPAEERAHDDLPA